MLSCSCRAVRHVSTMSGPKYSIARGGVREFLPLFIRLSVPAQPRIAGAIAAAARSNRNPACCSTCCIGACCPWTRVAGLRVAPRVELRRVSEVRILLQAERKCWRGVPLAGPGKTGEPADGADLQPLPSCYKVAYDQPPGKNSALRLHDGERVPMPEILNWRSAADLRGIVDRAVQALAEGRVVAFPTETVYGIAAGVWQPEAVERLSRSKGRPEDKPLALAVRGIEEALDWVPQMPVVGRRLARRCWPGPLTLVCDADKGAGLVERLAEPVGKRICPGP